ncbi:hypothetical protein Tco_0725559 [Tanacetum coccineum]|uniref:Uncharacterized protein n=1 Tax=Tanacetum coccineum TaxID=301880 RepID=A0ABQ4YFE0_9ASTR
MLYCIVVEEQYNLAYFFVKRIECARATSNTNLPYGMFLTCLFRHIMEQYPYLDNDIYNVVDRVMPPLALKQTRKPQRDDDENDGASRASTPSPTTYLNSLSPLNYEKYDIPTSSEQDDYLLFERQTTLLNQTQRVHEELKRGFKSASISKASKRPKINIIPLKQLFVDLTQDDTKTPSPKHQLSSPSAPNAPLPSTKDTSSSSIDYIPKSSTSSTSPSTNGYLNSLTSPPSRVPPPHPIQESGSMDITLTLSPITPLDVQFNTPSPSPPLFGHPIP